MTATNREVVAEALEAIYTEQGELTPDAVVDVASVPSHPLHAFFTWSDSEAAKQHRLSQARQLIRSITVRFLTEQEEGEVRQWHAARRVAAPTRTGYLPDAEVKADPIMAAALLRSMQREWLQMRRRWTDQATFWQMVVADIPIAEEGDGAEVG